MKMIALLPMKGNSERVPNKNLKDFHGFPLYHIITNKMLQSKYIDKVIINTDSYKIAKDARQSFGNKVMIIDRPKEIQGDFISMNDIINYDINYLAEENHFIQTHSTNPLLKTETIDKAIETYFNLIGEKKYDSVFSVTRYQTRLYWKDGSPVNHNPDDLIRTQDLPIIYEENSNFFIFSKDSFEANRKKRIGRSPFLFEMDKIEAIDIDEPEDFIIAEKLFNYE